MSESSGLRLDDENHLWFPGLTTSLLSRYVSGGGFEQVLVEEYGTARWLVGSTVTPVVSGGEVRIGPHVAMIEFLSDELMAGFNGLHFADSRALSVCGRVQSAANVLAHVPTLAESVGAVVKSIHPLRAQQDCDVSHSTPGLPFSVFVSVPEDGERDASLRVAESLVHEAMHLQLTILDSINPLIENDRASAYSPWKDENRPVTGLLHGLYVFAVIHEVLDVLTGVCDEWAHYCGKRRSAIEREVASLPSAPDGLSRTGLALWHRCIDVVHAV